jgi:uncharacterized repeat protein (TIGR01451 family)
MASFDLGDVVALGITITNSSGTAQNATAVVCTVTLPDGTSATPSVTNSGAGLYDIAYTPTQSGRHVVRWVATGTNASAFTDEFTVRDLTTLPVISYDMALEHLNIPAASANQEEIRRFIDAAQDLAENYVGAVLGRRTITSENYDGNVDALRLRNPRAISVTSVYENGALLDSSQYQLDPTGQRLYRLTTSSLSAGSYGAYGYWASGVNSVLVTYVAGFTVTPPAVQQGVLEILRHLWQTQRGVTNVMSRTGTGDDFYTGATYSLPRRAMELLDPASLPGLA